MAEVDGIHCDAADSAWRYSIDGRACKHPYLDKVECGKAYIEALVRKYPKYKALFKGKTWPQIFKIAGVKVYGGQK